ncbi:MAG: hypothetical protein Q4C55_02815 [Eubacterium sp.]|nr:hypothetical protein [Eubacterium sp.]
MIVTFNHIIELNKKIQAEDLHYKVHMSDACGSQNMWIEDLDQAYSVKRDPRLYEIIDAHFKALGGEVVYSWDKRSFNMKDRSLTF